MTPATASLQTGATQQFSANVTGATNTSVTWSGEASSVCQIDDLQAAASDAGGFWKSDSVGQLANSSVL